LHEDGYDVNGLHWCNYTWKEDECEGWYECHAEWNYKGEEIHGSCFKLLAMVEYEK